MCVKANSAVNCGGGANIHTFFGKVRELWESTFSFGIDRMEMSEVAPARS
jgi:hypothetical protein